MDTVLTLRDLGNIALIVAIIVLVIYLISVLRNVNKTLKKTNAILDDAAVVSGVASDKAKKVDGLVDDALGVGHHFLDMLMGNQSITDALSNIVNALGSLFNVSKNSCDAAVKKNAGSNCDEDETK